MILHYTDLIVTHGDESFEVDYDYEPDNREIEDALNEYIADRDLSELGADPYSLLNDDDFYDYLYEWCVDAAKEEAQDDLQVREDIADAAEYRRDPYSYYGVNRSDFF